MKRKVMRRGRFPAVLLVASLPTLAQPPSIQVSHFADQGLDGWTERSFHGHTRYRLDTRRGLIEAESEAAASGLFRKIEVDLRRTPYLNWSWRVDRPLSIDNERNRAGDDFAARLYVVKDGGLVFWRTSAINYVWSGSQDRGSEWPNPFTDRAMMHVQRGREDSGRWHTEKRNVGEDFLRLFGTEINHIDAVAIMTDTDNSGGKVKAWYGEIWFSED